MTGDSRAGRGALVISLDFELAWGVRDTLNRDGSYRKHLYGAREAVPRMLDLFTEFDVAATWATVGFLFAESRDELQAFAPKLRPSYVDRRFDPYREDVGDGEKDDPLHFASSLIDEISCRPRQEIASHTFSHYYCLEEGQSAEEFSADLASAVKIAAARGHHPTSLVFPRNQVRTDYLPALAQNGFTAYRGNELDFLNRPRPGAAGSLPLRALRLADAFLNLTGNGNLPWHEVTVDAGLVNVRSSRFLRPWRSTEPLEVRRWHRVASSMAAAARSGALFHLWWHPHNFGVNLTENLAALRRHLELYSRLRADYGFLTYSMGDVARQVAGA